MNNALPWRFERVRTTKREREKEREKQGAKIKGPQNAAKVSFYGPPFSRPELYSFAPSSLPFAPASALYAVSRLLFALRARARYTKRRRRESRLETQRLAPSSPFFPAAYACHTTPQSTRIPSPLPFSSSPCSAALPQGCRPTLPVLSTHPPAGARSLLSVTSHASLIFFPTPAVLPSAKPAPVSPFSLPRAVALLSPSPPLRCRCRLSRSALVGRQTRRNDRARERRASLARRATSPATQSTSRRQRRLAAALEREKVEGKARHAVGKRAEWRGRRGSRAQPRGDKLRDRRSGADKREERAGKRRIHLYPVLLAKSAQRGGGYWLAAVQLAVSGACTSLNHSRNVATIRDRREPCRRCVAGYPD